MLFGYNKEAGEEIRLVDCLGLNVSQVAVLMSEVERSKFLEKVSNLKARFPNDWKLPDDEVKVYRQGRTSIVFDAGGKSVFTLYLDNGGMAPFPKGKEFQW